MQRIAGIQFSNFNFNIALSKCGNIEIIVTTPFHKNLDTIRCLNWDGANLIPSNEVNATISVNYRRETEEVLHLIKRLRKTYSNCKIVHNQN